MVLTDSFVLSGESGLLVTVASGSFRQLDTGVEASGPHDFAVRLIRVRPARQGVHRIPRPTPVTIAKRPLCPGNLAEHANGRLSQNRPLLELSP